MSRGLPNSPAYENMSTGQFWLMAGGKLVNWKKETVGAGKCYSRGVINQSVKVCVECLIISITFTLVQIISQSLENIMLKTLFITDLQHSDHEVLHKYVTHYIYVVIWPNFPFEQFVIGEIWVFDAGMRFKNPTISPLLHQLTSKYSMLGLGRKPYKCHKMLKPSSKSNTNLILLGADPAGGTLLLFQGWSDFKRPRLLLWVQRANPSNKQMLIYFQINLRLLQISGITGVFFHTKWFNTINYPIRCRM